MRQFKVGDRVYWKEAAMYRIAGHGTVVYLWDDPELQDVARVKFDDEWDWIHEDGRVVAITDLTPSAR